ncbi:MAG: hypothetical protein RIT24_1151 [Planctomycetota bacterium]
MRERAGDMRGLRAWRAPLARAAIAWWGFAWLPMLFGPLTECRHCVQTWCSMLPVLPGFAPAACSGTNGATFASIAIVVTLAFVAATAVGMRELRARWLWLALPIGIAQAALDLGLAWAIRQ